MQTYNDSSIQYDSSAIKYDQHAIILLIEETCTYSESITKSVQRVISETATHTEDIVKSISTIILDTANHIESIVRKLAITISETATHTETLLKKVSFTITETVTHIEIVTRKISITLYDTANHVDDFVTEKIERIIGAIEAIKEFVRIGDKKDRVSAVGILTGDREELNTPELQYDDGSIVYDHSEICYNNYISSEKPTHAIGKKSNMVSLSDEKDKPSISKQ